MRILIFQHIACEHPGVFRDYLSEDGAVVHTVELDDGEPIPSLDGFDVLMVMGGPMDVWQTDRHGWLAAEMAAIYDWVAVRRRPYLGFCLGHQLLAAALGGTVEPAAEPEIGVLEVELTRAGVNSPFLAQVPRHLACFQWHSAEVTRLPDEAEILAASQACRVNAMSWGAHAFSIQFHVEITPATVSEWGAVPEYAAALEQALGNDALHRLERSAKDQMKNFNRVARQLYLNFMATAGV